jgi:hypothetical protein
MNSETRVCQNCKNSFTIEPDDFSFYEKIKVPPPTFCPECSHQRRFAWRNTHSLYNRVDSVTGKNLISIYSPDKKLNVVDQKYWWSDAWDPFDYGSEYDFSKTFFSQWKHLYSTIPLQALSNSKAVNSDYCNVAEESYDCYLISACWKNERTMYSDSIVEVKDSSDLYVVQKSEFCYEDIYCSESYRLLYSEKTIASTDSYFLYDCKGCVNCFMCSNLRNKSYCFENVQYSKEEYLEKIKQYNLGSFETIQKLKLEFESLKQNAIHKYATVIKSHNVTGDNISGAVDSKYIFDASNNIKDSKYLFWVAINIFNCYYSNAVGMLENSFETCDAGVGGSNCHFSNVVYSSNNIEYSFNCYNSSDLFGCIGLRSKSYCILNRQYSKEEYFELLPKVKKHMADMPYVDQVGRIYKYGEFFPVELSPFCYNETIANDFYPLSKEESKNNGFSYKEKEERHYAPTIHKGDMPDDIVNISDSILNEILECDTLLGSERCTAAFKITQNELTFYKRLNIPLPRRCYQCRHKERFSKRNPLKLWHRTCMCEKASHEHEGKCPNEFETSYAPDRPEIIYCEKCYQQEVI